MIFDYESSRQLADLVAYSIEMTRPLFTAVQKMDDWKMRNNFDYIPLLYIVDSSVKTQQIDLNVIDVAKKSKKPLNLFVTTVNSSFFTDARSFVGCHTPPCLWAIRGGDSDALSMFGLWGLDNEVLLNKARLENWVSFNKWPIVIKINSLNAEEILLHSKDTTKLALLLVDPNSENFKKFLSVFQTSSKKYIGSILPKKVEMYV